VKEHADERSARECGCLLVFDQTPKPQPRPAPGIDTVGPLPPPPPPPPLVADAGPDQVGSEGTIWSFVGSAAGGTPPYAYAWSLGDGAAGSDSSLTHRYGDNGTYVVTLTVSDAGGQSIQDTVLVTVANDAPTASAGGPYSTPLGTSVTLQGVATDPSSADTAAGLTFAWEFGDGTTGSGASPTHAYALPGTYSVRLVVTDKDGGAAPATTTVTVESPAVGRVIQVPAHAASVQLAIDLAASGDTVLVAPGTYLGPIVLAGKTITLASWFHTTGDPSYVGRTVLDGNAAPSTVDIKATVGPETTVVGFTIRNGGNGVLATGPFQLLHSRVVGNGDGVELADVRGAVVRFNTIESNGDDGIDLNKATSILIADNVIRGHRDDGIEIRLHAYTGPTIDIVVRNNIIADNESDGIQLIDQTGSSARAFYIEGNLFQGNGRVGIGMSADGNTREDFSGASITDPIFLTHNTFVGNNHAVTGGDNVTARNNIFAGSAGIALKNVDGTSTISSSLFWGNALDWQASNVDPLTTQIADPLFDSAHRLLPGSPAIDAGVDVGLPYSGLAPDLGAYETSPAP
jgi:PKD repeat protein